MGPLRGDEATVDAGRLVSRACAVDPVSPRALLALADPPHVVWAAPGEPTVAAAGAAGTVSTDGPDRFETVRAAAADLFDGHETSDDAPAQARPRLFGGFAFHGEATESGPWERFPGAGFVLPALQYTRGESGAWLTATASDPATAADRLEDARGRLDAVEARGEPPGIARQTRTVTREEWRAQVTAALEKIDRGDLRKVVLAQALSVDLDRPLSPAETLARLGETYPDCHRFLLRFDESAFFGATPETLVSLRGRHVETEALAGSTGRGDTREEDEWLARELAESAKDAHEHDLVVDAISDQLAPLAASVSTGGREVRRLATVQHLRTPITAELSADEHVLSLVDALHPTPAVGGLPPDAALATIRETETFDRGWYAAPVGWLDEDGDGTFAVGLRSAVGAGREATLFAGAGIVADSDPDREWDEVQLKYQPVLDALE